MNFKSSANCSPLSWSERFVLKFFFAKERASNEAATSLTTSCGEEREGLFSLYEPIFIIDTNVQQLSIGSPAVFVGGRVSSRTQDDLYIPVSRFATNYHH